MFGIRTHGCKVVGSDGSNVLPMMAALKLVLLHPYLLFSMVSENQIKFYCIVRSFVHDGESQKDEVTPIKRKRTFSLRGYQPVLPHWAIFESS